MDKSEDEFPSTSRVMKSFGGGGPDHDKELEILDKDKGGKKNSDSIKIPPESMTFAALLERNKILQATVLRLEGSLVQAMLEKEKAVTKYKNLKGKCKPKLKTDAPLGSVTWFMETIKSNMANELEGLLAEGKQVEGWVEGLTKELVQANVQKVMKMTEARELRRRVNILKRGLEVDTPLNGGAAESKEAVGIFPEEIWLMIFGNLTGGKDLWNISKACLLFHRKLHRLKTTFLFDQVFPYLFEHLPGADILKCRSICKEWNLGVDSFFENHPSIRPHAENKHVPQSHQFVNPLQEKQLGFSYVFSVTREEAVDLWHPKFGSDFSSACNSRNPFIGRSVRVELPVAHYMEEEDDEQGYFKKLYNFLENFGSHIWFLNVKLTGDPYHWTSQKICSFVTCDIFQLVPNLRSLTFNKHLGDLVMNELDVHSFPSAVKLETLELDCRRYSSSTEARRLNGALLKKFHGQLQRLRLPSEIWTEEACQLEWPKLVEFHIWEDHHDDFESLLQLKAPQLEKLVLRPRDAWGCRRWTDLPNFNEDNYCAFDSVLDIVGQIATKTRLTILRIHGEIRRDNNPYQGDSQPTLCREVPKQLEPIMMKTLELEYSPKTYHSFLIRFPFLENLMLFMDRDVQLGPEYVAHELIQINKYIVGDGGSIYKSNMWKIMSRLGIFMFGLKVFTRREFEMYHRVVSDEGGT